MNAQHQYTCPGARANSQIGLAGWRRRRSLSRARNEMGGRKTPKILGYAFSLSKSRLNAPAARFAAEKAA
jgi:hypothetical protein